MNFNSRDVGKKERKLTFFPQATDQAPAASSSFCAPLSPLPPPIPPPPSTPPPPTPLKSDSSPPFPVTPARRIAASTPVAPLVHEIARSRTDLASDGVTISPALGAAPPSPSLQTMLMNVLRDVKENPAKLREWSNKQSVQIGVAVFLFIVLLVCR